MRLAELGISHLPSIQRAGGSIFFGIVHDPTNSWPRGGWLAMMHFNASLRGACLPTGSVWAKFERGKFVALVEVVGSVTEDPNEPKPKAQYLATLNTKEWLARRNGNQ